MRPRKFFNGTAILALAIACGLGFPSVLRAQGTNPNKVVDMESQQDQSQQLKQKTLDQQQQQPAAPKIDPAEEAAYKDFFAASASPDTRIQLGTDFLAKYPTSVYTESVYSALVQAYLAKQDWKNFYATADKGLAAFPDDVTMLAVVGWVIPHVFDPNADDAQAKLDKAEKYEKHAIDIAGSMPKPAGLTDDQFAQTKVTLLSEAHSGLGLIYFRQAKYADSVSELQQATQSSPKPDQTDYFVMGVDLDRQSRFPEAADAYSKCAQINGGLAERCKQGAENSKKQASQPK